MAKMKADQLRRELNHFTGTTQLYYHPMFSKYKYTDGVRFLAQNAECYWLLEHIFIHQTDPKIKGEEFQVWEIKVEDSKARIVVDNGNNHILKVFDIEYTDFPLAEYKLWMVGDTLLLISEY